MKKQDSPSTVPRPLEETHRELATRRKKLMRLIRRKEETLSQMPEGHLCVVKGKSMKYTQYYQSVRDENGRERRIYLSKDKQTVIRQLAQKEYDKKVITAAREELRVIDHFLKRYPERLPEDIYNNYIEERRQFITPIIAPIEQFAAQWQNASYQKNPYPMEKTYQTAKGELVRSKSEVEIANYLYYLGIPYRYECALRLTDGRKTTTVYPDFTILDPVTREVFLLEHLGRMDDKEYVERAIEKRRLYEENGYFEGEKILYTWESEAHPLTRQQVERKLRHRLHL